jgi:hypothetical protein
MMGYIYTSFLISLLIWNSSYVVAILQGIILAINGIVYGAWSTPAADARAPAEVVA